MPLGNYTQKNPIFDDHDSDIELSEKVRRKTTSVCTVRRTYNSNNYYNTILSRLVLV